MVRRWGKGFAADDMKKCRWLKPQLVAAIDSLNGPPTANFAIQSSLPHAQVRSQGK